MHLSSLTLKGFKSFAAPTTLRLEPGVTCVVGPNGSGKSNVVDAIAWVLGEQGARTLRGGSMSDVIFAGSPGRAPLGRAEVTLVIDNADGALPIEHAEVAVSRLLYRTGESEYSINGTPCRLLDVQELLSDSGIGREMHVIVGQGQLDAVLQARPEDRRAYIEEAAGVLKHRKRKERALRKLDAMQGNLTRLTDLTAELRRQLTPLGKQAEVAKRAAVIQSNHRDSSLRLFADDLLSARSALEAEVRDEEVLRERRTSAEQSQTLAAGQVNALEAVLAESGPVVTRTQETFYRLSALQERMRGLRALATERHRLLDQPLETSAPGRDPEELEAEAGLIAAEQVEVEAQRGADQQRLDRVAADRADVEAALAREEQALVLAARAAADRREGIARLAGDVGAQRSRVAAAEEEIGRLSVGLTAARERAASSAHDLDALASTVGDLDEGELGLDKRFESAAADLERAHARVTELDEQQRSVERDRAQATARVEALALSLARRDGVGALLDAGLPGVLGTTAALIQVEHGMEASIAAALGAIADAVVVDGVDRAAQALAHLRSTEAGQVGLLVTGAASSSPPAPPLGCRWAADVVSGPSEVVNAVRARLAGILIVTDLDQARRVALGGHSAVTVSGDLLGPGWSRGGSDSAPSLLEVQAAHDEAVDAARAAEQNLAGLEAALAEAREAQDSAGAFKDAALEALHDNDARLAAIQERLGLLSSHARAAAGEAERLERSRREAETARDSAMQGLDELEQRLVMAEATDIGSEEPTELTGERDRRSVELTALRADEVERRLAVRTGEERVKALADRVAELQRAARAEREGRERLIRVRAQRERGARVAGAVAEIAADALVEVEHALAEAGQARQQAQQQRTVHEAELMDARASLRSATTEVDSLRDVAHRDEVLRTEQRLRIQALEDKVSTDWGIAPDDLINEYGPDVFVPGEPGDDGEPGPSAPYDRAVQERRAAAAGRQLAQLGKVNPLALEEFEALQERQAFLATQLEDLRATRKDLLGIVDEVDARIHEVFRQAFEDTAREFQLVFATLFPGGEGRLVLTEPDDLMITGVEVEARPAGKKVTRLSLLSGGERSLAAVALLLAIFRARPSPFYVLDEVEAALDDTNLGRLLDAFALLSERSQLVVITHQKRTMEIADALYGVTMRDDGVSTVVSQRLREHAVA